MFMTITPEVNMITKQITPFFHLPIKLYSFVYFIFAFQDLQNLVSWSPSFAFVLACKTHIYMSKMTLSSLLTNAISFFYITFSNFSHITDVLFPI